MSAEHEANRLYQQNLRLGHLINQINDENAFYRISINNIKKLNSAINKHLAPAQRNTRIDHKTITHSYNSITGKIQMKNLQTRVGNQKRRADRVQKVYEGSVSTLTKQAQTLEEEVSRLSRQHEYYCFQEQLLDNVAMADHYLTVLEQTLPEAQAIPVIDEPAIEQDIHNHNRLEHLLKEEKELKKQRASLSEKLTGLREERDKLAGKVYRGKGENLRSKKAQQVNTLKSHNQREQQLQDEITRYDTMLEEQYKINQEYKQKILDRTDQESKEIRVYQEEIRKYDEQVREIKSKCEALEGRKTHKTKQQ